MPFNRLALVICSPFRTYEKSVAIHLCPFVESRRQRPKKTLNKSHRNLFARWFFDGRMNSRKNGIDNEWSIQNTCFAFNRSQNEINTNMQITAAAAPTAATTTIPRTKKIIPKFEKYKMNTRCSNLWLIESHLPPFFCHIYHANANTRRTAHTFKFKTASARRLRLVFFCCLLLLRLFLAFLFLVCFRVRNYTADRPPQLTNV